MAIVVLESLVAPRLSLSLPTSSWKPHPSQSITVSASLSRRLPCQRPVRLGLSSAHPSKWMKPTFAPRRTRIHCDAQDTSSEVATVGDTTWKSLVIDSQLPVLVEFWAPWCGPCRMIHPVIDELSKQYAGKLKCYKVNTDESPSIATQYGIRSIPTVMIFKEGEKKDAIIGAVPKSTLTSSIEKFL